jgi:hypothetical protein
MTPTPDIERCAHGIVSNSRCDLCVSEWKVQDERRAEVAAVQRPSTLTPDIAALVAKLRSPAMVFYQYEVDEGVILRLAADALERLEREKDESDAGWQIAENELAMAQCLQQQAEARVATLEADQRDWRKGVDLIQSALGDKDANLCCVRLAEAALTMRAKLEQAEATITRQAELLTYCASNLDADRNPKLLAAIEAETGEKA